MVRAVPCVRRILRIALAPAFLLVIARGASGDPLPPPGDPAWNSITFPSIERHTRFDVVDAPATRSGRAWRAVAECSASGMAVDVGPIDLARDPQVLRWRWRRIPGPPSNRRADERERSGDDFAARVYAIFELDPSRLGAWLRLRHQIASRLLGRKLPGHALNYVWARGLPAGAEWRSPHDMPGHLVALRSASDEGWFEERVDLRADHERYFGAPRTPLVAIGIMSDTDDRCARAEAWFADLRLEPIGLADLP
jgi:hypothetical protein